MNSPREMQAYNNVQYGSVSTEETNPYKPLPSSDGRKLSSTILAITAVAFLFIGLIVGLVLLSILKFSKNADGEKALWKGFKYQAGMFFNLKDMKQKDLRECALIGRDARLTDDRNQNQAQWANTVITVPIGEGVGSKNNSLILSAQLTAEQVSHFTEMEGTTVIAAQEMWEQKNENGLKQFAEVSNYESENIHGVDVRKGNYNLANPSNVEQILVDLPDHNGIPVQTLDGLADLLNDEIQKGHVIVHCKSGRGRSAQIIVAYLMKHQDMTVNAAVERVSEARRFADVKKTKLKALFYQYAFTTLARSTVNSADAQNIQAIENNKERAKLLKASIDGEHTAVSALLAD